MWSFIVDHYRLILIGLWILIEVIFGVCVLLRKSKSNEPLHAVISQLPKFIIYAENKFGAGNGDVKKAFVLSHALSLFKDFTGIELKSDCSLVKVISEKIEEILKTPSKKEDK